MKNVIFTDTLSLAIIIAILFSYALLIAFKLILPKVKKLSLAITVLTLALHIALFASLLLAKAPLEEILLTTVASAALGLTASGIGGRE